MAFIGTIPANQAQGEVRSMYRRQQGAWGFVPNYAKVFSHRPNVMSRWANLLAEIRRNVDPRRFELVTFAAALALRHSYCALVHGDVLKRTFFSAAQIEAMARDANLGPLTSAEAAMFNFAQKVARDASSITAEDTAELSAHGFADDEIFDIVATAAS